MTTSDALSQFREEFGCWVTDNGMTSIGRTDQAGEVYICSLDLPALEKAIGELIAEAAGQAVDVVVGAWDEPLPPPRGQAPPEPAQVPLPAVLRQVIGDLQRRVARLEAWTDLTAEELPLPDQPEPAATAEHTWLSCGCPVLLPVRMARGREVLCSEHGPAVISWTEGWL